MQMYLSSTHLKREKSLQTEERHPVIPIKRVRLRKWCCNVVNEARRTWQHAQLSQGLPTPNHQLGQTARALHAQLSIFHTHLINIYQ